MCDDAMPRSVQSSASQPEVLQMVRDGFHPVLSAIISSAYAQSGRSEDVGPSYCHRRNPPDYFHPTKFTPQRRPARVSVSLTLCWTRSAFPMFQAKQRLQKIVNMWGDRGVFGPETVAQLSACAFEGGQVCDGLLVCGTYHHNATCYILCLKLAHTHPY
jgi:hypothetical protein